MSLHRELARIDDLQHLLFSATYQLERAFTSMTERLRGTDAFKDVLPISRKIQSLMHRLTEASKAADADVSYIYLQYQNVQPTDEIAWIEEASKIKGPAEPRHDTLDAFPQDTLDALPQDTLDAFPQFARLPAELQLKIWEAAVVQVPCPHYFTDACSRELDDRALWATCRASRWTVEHAYAKQRQDFATGPMSRAPCGCVVSRLVRRDHNTYHHLLLSLHTAMLRMVETLQDADRGVRQALRQLDGIFEQQSLVCRSQIVKGLAGLYDISTGPGPWLGFAFPVADLTFRPELRLDRFYYKKGTAVEQRLKIVKEDSLQPCTSGAYTA